MGHHVNLCTACLRELIYKVIKKKDHLAELGMLAGDLNLKIPDICLEDLEVLDCIKTSPTYGYENNSL